MKTEKRLKNLRSLNLLLLSICLLLFTNCEKESVLPDEAAATEGVFNLSAKAQNSNGPYEFDGAVYDISAAPNGGVMVALNDGDDRIIKLIKKGKMSTMLQFETPTAIQGIQSIGSGNAFVTTGGQDLAEFGELYRISNGEARIVADLAAFERDNDPDALEGIQWKNQACEAIDGFSAGPQNNPFKVDAVSGNTAFVADAAGNTLLSATSKGQVDWKAIFTPPVDSEGEWLVRWDAGGDSESIPCYVQPVPTSVAVGPDGYTYVGELTGALAEGLPIGLSRVWKIPTESNNVVCQEGSGDCELLIEGLTSVIDLEIGPDGLLYVVELDENSWISAFVPGLPAGGTISSYDLDGNLVEVVASGLSFPSAITFDKQGTLWLLENNNIPGRTPTLRVLN